MDDSARDKEVQITTTSELHGVNKVNKVTETTSPAELGSLRVGLSVLQSRTSRADGFD